MEILIVGCGRVGSNLATELIEAGEDITIIDSSAENLLNVRHLDCSKFEGVPLERSVLEKAGIDNVDVLLCVSDNENMNVMVGQIAMRIYSVDKVVVRIFNPDNEAVYQALGLQTICSTSMTMERVMAVLGFTQSSDLTSVLGYSIRYDLREVTESWEGVSVDEIERHMKIHVLAVVNEEAMQLVSRDYKFHRGEHVILVSLPEYADEEEE